ncbi:MAG: GNAT family N-acetyltransferase [Bacteroidales bacterium]|nr:GNAT family N-acetyltransferase [Lentimicrobiaceae bacterium]MDD5693712.1 GNAT family N-acetyltransferase [Bacteroidales bacterium]
MSEYRIIRINKSSVEHIKKLYYRCFKLRKSLNDISLKYDTSIFGLCDTGFLAFDQKNRPAAYYGVFPMIMSLDNKDYLVAQSGDTMTDPAHRGKGLFIELAKETYNYIQEKKVQFVFGFPNRNSYPGFIKKLNWEFYGRMKDFKFNNKAFPICELVSKFWILKPIYKKFCDIRLSKHRLEPNEEIVDKFNLSQSWGHVKKDLNYFKYKKYNTYLINYKDFIMLIKADSHLIVGDVAYFKNNDTEDFIHAVECIAKQLGCKKTIISLNENHWLYSYLSLKYTPVESLPIGFLRFSNDLSFEKISFCGADYDTF